MFAPCCWCLGCKPCAALIFGASRGSIFPRGSWGFSPPTSLIECTESRALALPFKEFPSILQDGVFALFIWWTGLFTMGYYNPSWLTTFFSFQVYFFCWATPCAVVLVNSVCSPSLAPVISARCWMLRCGRDPIPLWISEIVLPGWSWTVHCQRLAWVTYEGTQSFLWTGCECLASLFNGCLLCCFGGGRAEFWFVSANGLSVCFFPCVCCP